MSSDVPLCKMSRRMVFIGLPSTWNDFRFGSVPNDAGSPDKSLLDKSKRSNVDKLMIESGRLFIFKKVQLFNNNDIQLYKIS
jgi:hypothetical protein